MSRGFQDYRPSTLDYQDPEIRNFLTTCALRESLALFALKSIAQGLSLGIGYSLLAVGYSNLSYGIDKAHDKFFFATRD